MNCKICNQEIENDSQFINGNWYHNKCVENLQQEIERLNNIINEIEKYLEENKYFYGGYQGEDREDDLSIIHALNKLKELKESDEK